MSSEPGALLPVNKMEIGFGVIEYKVQIPAHQLCDLGCVKVYDAKLVFSLQHEAFNGLGCHSSGRVLA